MSALTIARAHPDDTAEGRLLTKIWDRTSKKPVNPRFPLDYQFELREFNGLNGLMAIHHELKDDPTRCIIRGRLKDGLDPRGWHKRRYKAVDAPLIDEPRDWLMVDIDDPVSTLEEMQARLMPELRGRAHVGRHSASSGHPFYGEGKHRLHLWFMLDRPLSSAQAKAWVKSWNHQNGRQMLDASIYTAGSIHFTCRPLVLASSTIDWASPMKNEERSAP